MHTSLQSDVAGFVSNNKGFRLSVRKVPACNN